MMILIPFIAFSMISALYYTVTRHKNISQLSIKNKLYNVIQENRCELARMPTATNTTNLRNTEPIAHQELNNGPATNKPSNTFFGTDETKMTTRNEQKEQVSQMTGETLDQLFANVTYSTILFSDSELELIRAGYTHRLTGKRKISRKNKGSYITARNGKIFDARKIIKVMQKKFTKENSRGKSENSMALKLQALHTGINALMTQNELPKNFVMPDKCIVHRFTRNVTYGELKHMIKTRKLSVQLKDPRNTENIIVNPSHQPRIKTLKINYKIKNSPPSIH